eukprot:scaffold2914_cov42-Phaeocystis_antarctica.AAC.1
MKLAQRAYSRYRESTRKARAAKHAELDVWATVAYIVDMANAFSPVGAAAYRTSAAVELVLSCSRELAATFFNFSSLGCR